MSPHGFSELTQIDTFFNGLNEQDQDSLNAVTGGNLLIEIVNKKVITPATVKAIEKSCVICGGAHAYYDCITTDSNQSSVCATTGTYNQVSPPNQASNQMAPPGFTPVQIIKTGTLSSNTIPNPKGETKTVTTRSGLAYEGPSIPTNSSPEKVVERDTEEIMDKEQPNCQGSTTHIQPPVVPTPISEPIVPKTQPKPNIPYPSRLNDQKLHEKATNQMEKLFQIFHDLYFDISFADALLLMPKFAFTIKSLLTNKDTLFELAKVPLNENCSAMLLKKLPEKLGDPRKFLIPCDFPGMDMTLELADRSITHPKGVAEDVFVKVGKFHFPTDFVVVDFEADPRVPLNLGRSFLRTGRALIDFYGEEITLRVNDESVTFNLNQTMRYSSTYDDNSVNRIDVIDIACEEYVHDVLDFKYNSKSEEIEDFLKDESIPTGMEGSYYDPEGDILYLEKFLNDDPSQLPLIDLKQAEETKAKSSIEEPSELELKELPSHLEYAFLEETDKLPVIIAKDLKYDEKEALLKVLKSHKRAIAWKIPTSREKCHFMCKEEIILGHKISMSGIKVDRAKVDVIANLPYHTTVKGLKCFLGHTGFYRRFIQEFSKIAQPKTHLLEKETPFVFSKDCIDAFETLMKKLTEALILVVPDWNLPFELMCDASDFAIGVVLGQRKTNHFQPIHYASKTMTEAQTHYTTTEKEMLAVVYAFEKFWPYLVLSKSIVYTDHSALKYLLSKQDTKPRLLRWVLLLQEFDITIHKLNDALWAFCTAFKTPIGCAPYKTMYEKSCHLPFELEHKAYWALKHANFDLKTVGDHRKLQLNELNELRDQAYENSLIYKERTKKLHDSKVKNRIFNVSDQVLLFNSRLKILSGKLKTRWSGPFTIAQVFSYGTVELSQPDGPNFKVNGHRVKHYFEGDIPSKDCPAMFEDSRVWCFVPVHSSFTSFAFGGGGAEASIPPKTTEQKTAKRNELKAKITLLLAIPEIHGEVISQDDANLKLMRSLPPAWNNHTLIMRNKFDIDMLSIDDLYNNLKVYEAKIQGQSSSSSNSQNVAFVSSDNTSSTNEVVNIAHNVSTASSQGQASASTYVDDVMFSVFANQSNSPQLVNEYLEQIDTDDLEEMNLKWQVPMLTMRVKTFIKKTRRSLNYNGKETVSFDKTKVECYNCHMRGYFARECRAPRNQGNRNGDNTGRVVPVETPANALVHSAHIRGLKSLEARIVVHQKSEAVFEEDIAFLKYDVMIRDKSITKLKNQFEESLKEKDDLNLKLEKFITSSKNLTNLINSKISPKDKTSLGYDSQLNERDLNDIHINKSDVFESASDSSVNESEDDNNQVNDRYKAGEGYHAVPPPYTGNLMPPRPDLSFVGLDDFVFKSVISETVTSVHETKTSASKSSKESMEKHKIVRYSAPLIEDWESDSDDDCEIRPSIKQNKPSHAKINFFKSDENTRKSIIKQHTYRQAKNLRKSQSSKVDKRNWNGMMTLKIWDGLEFKKKACFVCGSLNHLIKDSTSTSIARYVNTAAFRPTVNGAKTSLNVFHKSHSPVRRTFNQRTTPKNSDLKEKVNTAKVNNVTTARTKAVVSAIQGNEENAVKS
nr:reverse transcriptase domain-containing protein [Tanacetum cinerariifolium]